jgi:hypothetical protein
MERCRLTDKYGQQRTLTDDNGQQITHCLYVGKCRMVCFAARPTRPTGLTCPTATSQFSKPTLSYSQAAHCLYVCGCRIIDCEYSRLILSAKQTAADFFILALIFIFFQLKYSFTRCILLPDCAV